MTRPEINQNRLRGESCHFIQVCGPHSLIRKEKEGVCPGSEPKLYSCPKASPVCEFLAYIFIVAIECIYRLAFYKTFKYIFALH